jgi:hypothetical protein
VAEITLAGLHKDGSFSHLSAHVMSWMSNDIAGEDSSCNERSDELHIDVDYETRKLERMWY